MKSTDIIAAARSRLRQEAETTKRTKRRVKRAHTKQCSTNKDNVNNMGMISSIYGKGKRKKKSKAAVSKNIKFDKNNPKQSVSFYDSDEWRQIRYKIFERDGKICACCETKNGPFHVDHIVPRSHNRLRELDPTNLQVLCESCNLGKKAHFTTDWRPTMSDKGTKVYRVKGQLSLNMEESKRC